MKRGDVVLVVLKGDYGKPRPAVIVQSDALGNAGVSSVILCPMTGGVSGITSFRVAVEPTAATGIAKPSEIMVEKLTGVPRDRVRAVIGRLEPPALREVERALLLVLGFA